MERPRTLVHRLLIENQKTSSSPFHHNIASKSIMTSTVQAWRYHKGGFLPNILKLDEVEIAAPAKGEVRIERPR